MRPGPTPVIDIPVRDKPPLVNPKLQQTGHSQKIITHTPAMRLHAGITCEWTYVSGLVCGRSVLYPESAHPDKPLIIPTDISDFKLNNLIREATQPFVALLVAGADEKSKLQDIKLRHIALITRIYELPEDYSEESISVPTLFFNNEFSEKRCETFMKQIYRPAVIRLIKTRQDLTCN